jgi:ankyrin repeat protein
MEEILLYTFETIINSIYITQEKKIRLLGQCIAFGIDINHNDSMLLFSAITYNDLDVVRFLIDNGINVTARHNQAIIDACDQFNIYNVRGNGNIQTSPKFQEDHKEHRSQIIKLLISSGADASAQNNGAILRLSDEDYVDINVVKLLVENGANPFICSNALFENVCDMRNIEVCKYLINIGVDCTNLPGICVFTGGDSELKKLLLDSGYNPNTIGSYDKMSLLERAICDLDIDTCKLLFDYNADVNSCHNIIDDKYEILKTHFVRIRPPEKEAELIDLFMQHGLDISTDRKKSNQI